MPGPYSLERLTEQASVTEADIVLVDYAQRLTSEKRYSDSRQQTNAVMSTCREIAERGCAVIVISALSRQKDSKTAGYATASMGLASFRESSELEYGADSAFLLIREDDTSEQIELRCVKNRH